jgi:type I restriction enzyme, S subunit
MAGEWRERPLGELTDNFDGIRVPVKESDRRPGPYPYYGASGIVDYVDGFLFDGEYLLIAEDGENLRTRTTPVAFLAQGRFWVNNHAHIVRANGEAKTRFLMYSLAAIDISGYLTGSTMPKLTQANMNRIPLLTPPLPEQRAIAHILGTLDDKIELNRRMSETLEAMARALFKSWFVDFDPVRAKQERRKPGLPRALADLFPKRFVDSELGEIPEGWEVRALYNCADYTNGSAFRNDHFSEERRGLPIIKIGELKDGITAQTKFTEAILDPRYRVASGALLFSWSGSPDTSIDIFVWTGPDGWLNQHIFRITFKRPEEKFFVYYLLRHLKPVFIEVARDKQTTGLGHVTAQDLKRLKTAFPSSDIIGAFNYFAEPLFERAYLIGRESSTLAALRDTLLPKLISGELRVKDTEKFIGRAV